MNPRLHLVLLHALLFASGFAGLGYEIVWARMLSVGLGHEILAVFAVIAAFFSGLALGAWCLDGPVARARMPGRWYAGLELITAGWSLTLIGLIPIANRLMPALIGEAPSAVWHWTVAFALPFLLLLPATFAMGGTLPAIERVVARLARGGSSVAGLYAANTFGAFAGTILTTFLVIPELGISGTLALLAAINLVCAAGALLTAARPEEARALLAAGAQIPLPPLRLTLTLFITGLIGIGYEVLIIRVLAQVMENTVYSFASALSVYLLGTAIGAALYQRFARGGDHPLLLTRLLQAAALACLSGVFLLSLAPSAYAVLLELIGRSFAGSIAAELSVATLVFLLPTVVMGAIFSHLAAAARGAEAGLGRALAINTLGASLAPLLFGVIALPMLGSLAALLAVSLAYLALIPQLSLRALAPAALPAATALAIILSPIDLRFVTVPPGGRVVEHVEGVIAAVSVVADAQGDRQLKVDNHFRMGSTASAYSDQRQSHIPLLLHPDPKRALFLGIGTGATFAGAADFPGLEADGVELVPEILSLLPYFAPVTGDLRQARLHLTAADARRYVQATRRTYDVVIADLFHPARDGSGSLYTREHFAAIRARLNQGGIFCQWLPLYQLDMATLQTIIRTFLAVCPDASAYVAHYSLITPLIALVGGNGPLRFSPNLLDGRLSDARLLQKVEALRLDNPYALLGGFLAGADDLRGFAGEGPLNTDDRPLVTFRAPETVYAPLGPASERLVALVDRLKPQPRQVLRSDGSPGEAEAGTRLAAYWSARDAFLRAGLGVMPSSDPRVMVEQVRQPLLSIVRTSPDFEPAYMPLLSLASALYRLDRDASISLLTDLAKANPARSDARQLLDRFASQGR